MKTKAIKINIPLLLVAIITLVGFFVGSRLDEQISLEIGNQGNPLAIAFTAVGCFPTLFLAVFAGAALTCVECRTKFGKIFLKIIGILAIIIVSAFLYYTSSDYAKFPIMLPNEKQYKILLAAVVVGIDAVIIVLTILFRKKFNQRNLFAVSILILSVVASCGIISEFIKILASRPRPSYVLHTEGITFKEWFDWYPFFCFQDSNCKSFVSGHACDSACLMTVAPLFFTLITPLNKKKYTYIIVFICSALFAYFTAFTRLVAHAHYLTDIMGGILISILCQSICIRLVPFILKKIDLAITKSEEKKKAPVSEEVNNVTEQKAESQK